MEIFLGWRTPDVDVLVLFKHFFNDCWFRQSVSSGTVIIMSVHDITFFITVTV
jgi:hypothetical protein